MKKLRLIAGYAILAIELIPLLASWAICWAADHLDNLATRYADKVDRIVCRIKGDS